MKFHLLLLAGAGVALAQTPASPTFESAVKPVLTKSCGTCHNSADLAGDLNLSQYPANTLVDSAKDLWTLVASKVRTGSMPPPDAPASARPSADEIKSFVSYLTSEIDRLDRAAKPNPGRTVARRLNRVEYRNAVRDILGVHYQTEVEFPSDDSSFGFDNVGEALTVSPVLIEKYMYAAERIARIAVGGDPLPKPALVEERRRAKRLTVGSTQAVDSVDYGAEYVLRTWVAGDLGPMGKPVMLEVSVDGKVVKTVEIPTAQTETTRVAATTQRINEEVRVYLPAGQHTFFARLVGEQFDRPIPRPTGRGGGAGGGFGARPAPSIFPETFDLHGPFAPTTMVPANPLISCDVATGAACVEKIITPLARRAFRRQPEPKEVATLVGIANRARTAGYSPLQSLQFAIQGMLVSPQFLFRIEKDPAPGEVAQISENELAQRLSFFLWSSVPDEQLLKLAEDKKLRAPGELDRQVKRMISDPRAESFAKNFTGQWLEIRTLDAVKPDVTKFPTWNADLKEDMETETRMFFEAVLKENKPITDFIDGKYTYLNDRLATHYGIEGVTGTNFRKVDLTTDQRGGVLSHASVLTVTSYPARTSAVLRGKFILDNVLGTPPPPPPANVPALDEDAVGKTGSLRQQMEKHRSAAICASCHSRMDPLGFGLENYNPIGQWRTKDGEFPLEIGGTLPNGKQFDTPAKLRTLLRNDDLKDFTRNLSEKMLTYSVGRGVDGSDRPFIKEIVDKMEQSEYRFQTLIESIVHSLPFQARRGDTTAATVAKAGE